MEKLLLTAALDERDLMVKKINDKINNAQFTDTKKVNEERTYGSRLSLDEFKAKAQSSYQQIVDYINRYYRLDAAIVNANANTIVKTSFGDYTVAAAISLRNALKDNSSVFANKDSKDFEFSLLTKLQRDYKQALIESQGKNKDLERAAEGMRLSILGKEAKVKDDKPLEVVSAYVAENTTEVIDPLDANTKAQELKDKRAALLAELETQIKVANATTTIEF